MIMSRLLIATSIALAMPLASCAALQSINGVSAKNPKELADATKMDELTLIAAELSYKAARTIIETAVDEGRIKPALAAKFFRLNGKINGLLVRAERAYDAANSTSYSVLLNEVAPLIQELWKLVAQQEKPDGI
jgi:hypothetical protein